MKQDKIILHNAVFYAYHGVMTDEQSLGGKFEVDVELVTDLARGSKTDSLHDTVNYVAVYNAVKEFVLGKKFYLLEALAGEIAKDLLKMFPQVKEVTVRVRKPNAPSKV